MRKMPNFIVIRLCFSTASGWEVIHPQEKQSTKNQTNKQTNKRQANINMCKRKENNKKVLLFFFVIFYFFWEGGGVFSASG